MKRVWILILSFIFIFSMITAVSATGDIKVTVNGVPLVFDVPPQIINGRTLVPIRAIAEALDFSVEWEDASNTVIITREQEDELVYLYDMKADEISAHIRGKIFQCDGYYVAAGWGELLYFAPQGNEYYWFCNGMDEQSRIRAEYGTWELKDGFMTTTATKIVEWVGGRCTQACGITGSRYELEGYNEVLTKIDIESEFNFHMFKFNRRYQDYTEDDFGFYYNGKEYYNLLGIGGIGSLKKEYERYFSLLEK
jgi:hypothetical protein